MIFWRYGNSLYLFFFTLVVIASVFMILLAMDTQDKISKPSYTPLEIFNLTYYELSEQKTPLEVHAKHAYRQDQNYQIQEYIIGLQAIEQKDQQTEEKIYADMMIRSDQMLFFPHGINFWKEDAFFWSEKGTYEIKERFFQGEGDFVIQPEPENILYGVNLSYDHNLSLSYAERIKALLVGDEYD